LGGGGLAQRANNEEYRKQFHFNPCWQWNPAGRDGIAGHVAIIQFDQKSLSGILEQNARYRASCPSAAGQFSHSAHDAPAGCRRARLRRR
jgi:hypothetical protein